MTEPCSCGQGCDCGCCEGTEPLTPRTIPNRPGLDALAYRIGTHSSFLETMKARLTAEELRGLTTREAGDASLALLDAWAVVAGVLTFYQERIANEGYLRTATERRSVLELARLVGYSPRPGVASSVHLAYLLDPGPETVIAAGAGSRSVPGPGEMPQTFETSEDLTARAAWNLLQVRLTRPQQPAILPKVWSPDSKPVSLYFKGIDPQLKPNDPLLIETDCDPATPPALYRVLEVKPDAVQDRTRVEVEPWRKDQDHTFYGAVAPEPRISAEALRETVERLGNIEAQGISSGATARRVLSNLEPLKAALDTGAGEPELRAAVEEVLPKLREEHRIAVEKRASRLEPWIDGLATALEGTLIVPENMFINLNTSCHPTETFHTTQLPNVLETLGKPSKPQPRSRKELDREAGKLFGPGSDLSAQLLTVAQPRLRDVLYRAWANVPVTPPPCLRVCALRTRASVFGHNAPLEFVRREENGVVINETREWALKKETDGVQEPFHIETNFFFDAEGPPEVRFLISLGNHFAERRERLENNTFTLSLGTIEFVDVSLFSSLEEGPPPLHLQFKFRNRGFVIDVDLTENTLELPEVKKYEQVKVTGRKICLNTILIRKPSFLSTPDLMTIAGSVRSGGSAGTYTEVPGVVWLDAPYPQILPGSCIVLERPTSFSSPAGGNGSLVVAHVQAVGQRSQARYGVAAKSTQVQLDRPWLDPDHDGFDVIRETAVFAQCEELALAEEPIEEALCGGEIELAGLYDGLQPGRWLIVSGERTDVGQLDDDKKLIVPVAGVPATELVMLAGVTQGVKKDERDLALPGERTLTTLTLAKPLAHCYRRDTVSIYGNVVHATHGETRFEVMGSGDGSKALQSFTLRQPPLTYVSAPTPSGIESTLQVRVNDLLWHEADSLAGLGPADRSYITRTDDEARTTVVFGNGVRGARLPTGPENVRAAYRNGIGPGGNVKAGQISQLMTRPLGVKDVINPLPATGGAGPESRDQARRNAPLAVMALDRLISVQDYQGFARTFAGIGKASASRLSDGRVRLVHLTIAGEDDIPIGEDSDLFTNLEAALRRFGDPRQPLRLAVREGSFLFVEAEVRVLPDTEWAKVEPRIRAAMLDAFGFARRDLGQDVLLSEVYRTIQGVRGVDLVDVNLFARKDPEDLSADLDKGDLPKDAEGTIRPGLSAPRLRARLARIEEGKIHPAQLLYLTPEVPDTLILKERKS